MFTRKILFAALAACFTLSAGSLHAAPNTPRKNTRPATQKQPAPQPSGPIFHPTRQVPVNAAERAAEIERRRGIAERAQTLFGLMLAEIAYQQSPWQTLQMYLYTLNKTPSAEVAERAMELAIQLRADGIAEQIYQKWQAIEPQPSPAQQRLQFGLALATGDFKTALASLDTVLANANDEQKKRIFLMLAQTSITQPRLGEQGRNAIHRAAMANSHLTEAAMADIFANVGKGGDERLAIQALQRVAAKDAEIDTNTQVIMLVLVQNHPSVLARFFEQTPTDKLATSWRELEVESLIRAKEFDRVTPKLNALLSDTPSARLYFWAAAVEMGKNPKSPLALSHFEKVYQLGDDEQKTMASLSAAMFLASQEDDGEGEAAQKASEERNRQALAWLQKAPLNTRHNFDVHTLFAALYASEKQWAQAERHLQLAQKEDAQSGHFFDAAYLQRLTVQITAQKQPAPRAVAQLSRLLQQEQQRHPRNNEYIAEILYQRALLYTDKLQQHNLAVAGLRQVLSLRPNNPEIQNALGYTLLMTGNKTHAAEAMELIQAAHKQQPDNPAILDSLGWAYYLQGDLDKALEYLESAYQKFKNAEVGAHLGTLYWQKGRQDEARKVWREGWQKEPDNQILQQTLKQFGVSFTAGSTR